jgi:hypothetical protein
MWRMIISWLVGKPRRCAPRIRASQSCLAELGQAGGGVGVNGVQIADIEVGRSKWAVETAHKLAEALGLEWMIWFERFDGST